MPSSVKLGLHAVNLTQSSNKVSKMIGITRLAPRVAVFAEPRLILGETEAT